MPPTRKIYKIKKNVKKGHCRISGCTRNEKARQLCDSHHSWFSTSGQLDIYGAPDKKKYFKDTKYAIKKKLTEGSCRIIEDDKACDRDIHQRGLCTKHASIFRLHKCIEKYAGPSTKNSNPIFTDIKPMH